MTAPGSSSSWARPALTALALATLTYLLFAQSTSFEFLHYDDPDYVVANVQVQSGLNRESITWAWTGAHASNWHPLTWMSHMLDVQLGGSDPAVHHRTSVFLHALNAALCFLLFWRATRNLVPALFVAALFALHPLRVESVAWVAERKDLLAGTFWFTTLLAYQHYLSKPGFLRMMLVSLAFALGMASKPMVVSLPFVLLLWDVWPAGRAPLRLTHTDLKPRLTEKLVPFGLALVLAAVTLVVQTRGGATNRLEDISLAVRGLNALAAYGIYLYQCFVPLDLAVFYPHAVVTSDAPVRALLGPAALSALAYAAWFALGWRVRRELPAILVGWLWMVVTALPVIGLVQVGSQAHADRYTYLPTLGLWFALVFGLAQLVRTRPALETPALALGGTALASLAFLTHRQLPTWSNTESLFEHALEVTERNYTAYAKLGELNRARGNNAAAKELYRRALEIHPNSDETLANLGLCFLDEGEFQRARKLLERSLAVAPSNHETRTALGVLELLEGNVDAAERNLQSALSLAPGSPDTLFNLALIEEGRENAGRAEAYYRRALASAPDHSGTLNNLAELCLARGDADEAVALLERLRALEGGDPYVHFSLGRAYRGAGRSPEARASFEEVLRHLEHVPPGEHADLRTVTNRLLGEL